MWDFKELTSVLSMPLMQAWASSLVLNVMKAKPRPGLKKSVTSPYFSTFQQIGEVQKIKFDADSIHTCSWKVS